ncbi:MAG: YceI family protein [Solirubrobacteraceae bacterium]
MPIVPGVHRLGPGDATLLVRTGRAGAAARAGHDLVLEVTAWTATLEISDSPSLTLDADATSLRVRSGTGGIQALGDDDKANIETTIDDDVLKRTGIAFRSTTARADGATIDVQGELELAGRTHPLAFPLTVGADGALSGSATVSQSDWGMKPYSALFGTLKVADEVQVVFEGTLPAG